MLTFTDSVPLPVPDGVSSKQVRRTPLFVCLFVLLIATSHVDSAESSVINVLHTYENLILFLCL